ncbi:MAG: flagellar motor switch protein FliM [Clostridia bacterium]|nr:flagellar motor switch protein FliM [Clostridia bacterium]
MADILSQSEIDTLLNALQTGEIDAETIKEEQNKKKIRVYDFRRPDKFSKEQLNTIEVISENFSRMLTTFFSGQLRTRIQIKIASVEQITYDEFTKSIPNPSILNIFNISPLEGKAILEINPHLAFFTIDRLFGGPGVSNVKQRPLTEIEQLVMIKTVKKMLGFFKEAWSTLIELNPEFDTLETNPNFVQIVSPTEMVVLITLDLKLGNEEGLVNICLPCLMLEPIADKLNARYWYGTTVKEQTGVNIDTLKNKVEVAKVTVAARLGKTTLSVKDLLDLQIGDVIPLNKSVDSEVDLIVGSKPKFKGKIGVSGNKLAVQINKLVTMEEADEE